MMRCELLVPRPAATIPGTPVPAAAGRWCGLAHHHAWTS